MRKSLYILLILAVSALVNSVTGRLESSGVTGSGITSAGFSYETGDTDYRNHGDAGSRGTIDYGSFTVPGTICVPEVPQVLSGKCHTSTGSKPAGKPAVFLKSGHIVNHLAALHFSGEAGLMPSGHTKFSQHIISLRKLRC